MNCTDIHTILDEHGDARLTAAAHAAIDAHLSGCDDCAAAWHAHGELLALPVPAAPPALLYRVRDAIDARARRGHTSRRVVMLTSVLVAGAALAAIAVTQLPQRIAEQSVTSSVPAQAAPSASSRASVATDRVAPAFPAGSDRPVDTSVIAVDMVPIVRTPPVYPADAMTRRLEGSVTVQFDVAATGAVENAGVAHSTDPVFDEAALAAVKQWKYLPRVADGKRVARKNVQTVLRFQLDTPGTLPPGALPRAQAPTQGDAYLTADLETFTAAMEVALDRIATDNFRGAELQLDELCARYELDASQEGSVWDFYAYLYLVQGNYDRAIDAYETAVAAYARGSWVSQSSSLALANLYYARHQYVEALRTLVKFKDRVAKTPILAGRPEPIVDGFVERLRALGTTEDALPPQ